MFQFKQLDDFLGFKLRKQQEGGTADYEMSFTVYVLNTLVQRKKSKLRFAILF